MAHLNIEIKARCTEPERVRRVLRELGADFRGGDHQVDTYFHCPSGRLKLRQGQIENNLIHYHRGDKPGPKPSRVMLCQTSPKSGLRELLGEALGVLVVVEKRREIYFVDNVKFHIDTVEGRGSFVEIEAIDCGGRIGAETLQEQCERYMELLAIRPDDLIDCSYSDMLLAAIE
jgi:adenylate cyclase class 2